MKFVLERSRANVALRHYDYPLFPDGKYESVRIAVDNMNFGGNLVCSESLTSPTALNRRKCT